MLGRIVGLGRVIQKLKTLNFKELKIQQFKQSKIHNPQIPITKIPKLPKFPASTNPKIKRSYIKLPINRLGGSYANNYPSSCSWLSATLLKGARCTNKVRMTGVYVRQLHLDQVLVARCSASAPLTRYIHIYIHTYIIFGTIKLCALRVCACSTLSYLIMPCAQRGSNRSNSAFVYIYIYIYYICMTRPNSTMRPNLFPICDPTNFHYATKLISTTRPNLSPPYDPTYFNYATKPSPLCAPAYFHYATQQISTMRPNISPLYSPTEARCTVQEIMSKQSNRSYRYCTRKSCPINPTEAIGTVVTSKSCPINPTEAIGTVRANHVQSIEPTQ